MKKNEKSIQSEIKDIYYELAQCREDERSYKNQIFQLLAVLATFLTVLTALMLMVEDNEIYAIIAFALGIISICAIAAYISNIGLLNTLRHHYVIELEKRLDELINFGERIPNWEHLSGSLITLNVKHTSFGLLIIYFINNYATLISVILLATIYVTFNYIISPKSIITFCLLIFFILAMILFAITVIIATQHSKSVFDISCSKAKARYKSERKGQYQKKDTAQRKGLFKAVLYYLYPRPKDIQKIFFIFMGVFMGYVGQKMTNNNHIPVDISWVIYIMFLFDFLIYQARYQWNDLRGLEEDAVHKAEKSRCRLPISFFSEKHAVIISLASLVTRLILTFFLIYKYGKSFKLQILICMVLIFLIATVYEFARYQERVYYIFALVCLGYPARVICGLLLTWENLFKDIAKDSRVLICYVLILLSTAAFGEAFVSLTWAQEISYIKTSKKVHLQKLKNQIGEDNWQKKYPLRKRGLIKSIWNISFLVSMVFLCSAYLICLTSMVTIIGMAGILMLMIASMLMNGRRIYLLFPTILISAICFYYLFLIESEILYLFLLISILHVIYFAFYILFRHMNYEEMYGMFGKIFFRILVILKICKKLAGNLFKTIFGMKVYDILTKKKGGGKSVK